MSCRRQAEVSSLGDRKEQVVVLVDPYEAAAAAKIAQGELDRVAECQVLIVFPPKRSEHVEIGDAADVSGGEDPKLEEANVDQHVICGADRYHHRMDRAGRDFTYGIPERPVQFRFVLSQSLPEGVGEIFRGVLGEPARPGRRRRKG